MKEIVFTSAFVVVGLLPFHLIARWRHWGLLGSVVFGWVLIHVCNVSFRFEEPVDTVFTGLWAVLGWLYMLVWCLPVYGGVLLWAWFRRRKHV
ncbi:MAG: hypothetical protein ACUVWX_00365 [Kiritimatiellia bacterium]